MSPVCVSQWNTWLEQHPPPGLKPIALTCDAGKLRVAELLFDVPVNYSKPNEGSLRLFARSVHRLVTPVESSKEEKQLPWLVYLQGGPGMGCRPPQEYGWVGTVLDKGYQVSVFRLWNLIVYIWEAESDH